MYFAIMLSDYDRFPIQTNFIHRTNKTSHHIKSLPSITHTQLPPQIPTSSRSVTPRVDLYTYIHRQRRSLCYIHRLARSARLSLGTPGTPRNVSTAFSRGYNVDDDAYIPTAPARATLFACVLPFASDDSIRAGGKASVYIVRVIVLTDALRFCCS